MRKTNVDWVSTGHSNNDASLRFPQTSKAEGGLWPQPFLCLLRMMRVCQTYRRHSDPVILSCAIPAYDNLLWRSGWLYGKHISSLFSQEHHDQAK